MNRPSHMNPSLMKKVTLMEARRADTLLLEKDSGDEDFNELINKKSKKTLTYI